MSAYPVSYDAEFVERRNRLSVFFRLLLLIPHALWGMVVGFAAFFTVIAAWVAVVLTGRYPQGLYDFNAGVVRWVARYNAFHYLQDDAFPPFHLRDEPGYPVRVRFAGPLPEYSRLKALLRIVLVIPVGIVVYLMSMVLAVVAVIVWLVAVVTGKSPRALHDVLDVCLAYTTKGLAYAFLLTERYPPFENRDATLPSAATPWALGGAPDAPPTGSPTRTEQRPGGLEG